MGAIVPVIFGVSMWAYIFSDIPTHFYKRIRITVEVFEVQSSLVEQQKQIPIRVFVVVSTRTRTI